MSNHPEQPSTSSNVTSDGARPRGQPRADNVSAGKRSLLKLAWTVPLIIAVSLPKSGFASNISGSNGSNGKGKKDKDK